MPWPAAHRSGGAQVGGVGPAPGGVQPWSPPKGPANDNVPKPANDNIPRPHPNPGGNAFGRRKPLGGAVARVARATRPLSRFVRFSPWIGMIFVIYDVWQYYDYVRDWGPDNRGWKLVRFCRPGFHRLWDQGMASCSRQSLSIERKRPPANARLRNFFFEPGDPGAFPGQFWNYPQSQWQRIVVGQGAPAGQMWPSIPPRPAPRPNPAPWVLPTIDPFAVPTGRPAPVPGPLPRKDIRAPRARPSEGNQSDRGYRPDRGPNRRPGPSIKYRRPKGREKEKKTLVRKGLSIVLKGGYAVTEWVDFIEALYDGVAYPKIDWLGNKVEAGRMPPAIPEHLRKPGLTEWQKAQELYKHWDQIDYDQALLNLAANQVIDLAVGVPQGKLTQFANDLGIVHGNAFETERVL